MRGVIHGGIYKGIDMDAKFFATQPEGFPGRVVYLKSLVLYTGIVFQIDQIIGRIE